MTCSRTLAWVMGGMTLLLIWMTIMSFQKERERERRDITKLFSKVGFDKQLKEAPSVIYDKENRKYYFGRYWKPVEDPLFHPLSKFEEFFTKKEWHYTSLTVGDYFLGMAIAQFNYASSMFLYILNNSTGWSDRLEFAHVLGTNVEMAESSTKGCTEWFAVGGNNAKKCFIGSISKPEWQVVLNMTLVRNTHISANFSYKGEDAMCLVYPLGEQQPSYVHKASAMHAAGSLLINEELINFNNGLVNIDWTRGLHSRSTTWYWASLAFVDTTDNARIGLQLSQGIYDDESGVSMESALWINDQLVPLDEHVVFQIPENPLLELWKIKSNKIDLHFWPMGTQHTLAWVPFLIDIDLKHCFGRFKGTIKLGDKEIHVDALGVTEDHISKW